MRQGLRFPFANSAALWGITGALVLLYISDLTFISDLIFFFCSFLLLSYPASRLWACGRWWANLPMDCECTSVSSQRCVGHGVCIKQASQKMSHRGAMCFKRWLLELPPQSLTEKTETAGDFLVVQWLRLCLPVQGVPVLSQVRELRSLCQRSN